MLVIILAGIFICCGHEALQEYKAEKYAKNVVYGLDTNFFDFMFTKHPVILITAIILIILIIAYCFA